MCEDGWADRFIVVFVEFRRSCWVHFGNQMDWYCLWFRVRIVPSQWLHPATAKELRELGKRFEMVINLNGKNLLEIHNWLRLIRGDSGLFSFLIMKNVCVCVCVRKRKKTTLNWAQSLGIWGYYTFIPSSACCRSHTQINTLCCRSQNIWIFHQVCGNCSIQMAADSELSYVDGLCVSVVVWTNCTLRHMLVRTCCPL